MAGGPEETHALHVRVEDARTSAAARGVLGQLDDFEIAVRSSVAVMNRSLAVVDWLVSSENQLLVSYYRMARGAGARLPQQNEWDLARERNDSSVSPQYYNELNFACLSLDDEGLPWFGECAVTFADTMIAQRATVFEENPFAFTRKHPLGGSDPVPFGYRAVWEARSQLAVAKLHSQIEITTTHADFSGILVEKSPSPDVDYIEVHIYGPLHPRSIAHVYCEVPAEPVDALIWERTRDKLVSMGATVREHR